MNASTLWVVGHLCCCSVTQSCLTLCNPMDARHPCPSPSPELAQTHVHWVGGANQPSHPLSLPSIFPSIRVFSNEPALHIRWPKYWASAPQTELKSSRNVRIFTAEKEMETHSSVLALRIPGMGEPGGLLSMGLHRVGHNWSDLAAAAAESLLSYGFLLKTMEICFQGALSTWKIRFIEYTFSVLKYSLKEHHSKRSIWDSDYMVFWLL